MYLKSALKRASSDGEASAPRNVQSSQRSLDSVATGDLRHPYSVLITR